MARLARRPACLSRGLATAQELPNIGEASATVENQRVAANKLAQRTVLGEINDTQQAAWRKTLAVFDEHQRDYRNLSLFPEDRAVPVDAVDSL